MSILNKYKRWKNPFILVKDNYLDFVLSLDGDDGGGAVSAKMSEDCLVSFIDFANERCYTDDGYKSLPEYTWENAECSGVTLLDIGFTGMDNGLITFDKDSVKKEDFFKMLTTSVLTIPDGEKRLTLNGVTGNTETKSYAVCEEDGYVSFKGGFLQGFYKLEDFFYQTLPDVIEDSFHFEFTIRPMDYITDKCTLNHEHPENNGIFFYMGTRAENKFAPMYGESLDDYPDRSEFPSCSANCSDYFLDDYLTFEDDWNCVEYVLRKYGVLYDEDCDDFFKGNYMEGSDDDFNLTAQTITDSDGTPMSAVRFTRLDTENKFLLFDRTKNGFTTKTWEDGTQVTLEIPEADVDVNLFLIMSRAKTGLTADELYKVITGELVYDIETDSLVRTGKKPEGKGYDIKKDIYNNAFALRINENMGVGYRYLVRDCDSDTGYKIEEEYTKDNMVENGKWSTINVGIRLISGGVDECGNPIGDRKIKIYIYVDGYLKLVSKELPDFNFHALNDSPVRQEGVPYNISLGGGTQGLSESIWLRFKEIFPKVLPIEENFAGTFIGDMKTFRFYSCPMAYNKIKSNYLFERLKYNA